MHAHDVTSFRPPPAANASNAMLAARQTRIPGRHRQHAVRGYSEGRASPCSFVMHNVANISNAIQAADAQTISIHLNAASACKLRVS